MIISLLTDYGIADEFVGVCHGVIADAAPDARVIDVTHGIRRHDVRHGALVLRNALPTHYLEAWGDARAYDGTVSLMQPLIAPLYNGKSAYELLAALLEQPEQSGREIVQEYWRSQYQGADFDHFWRAASRPPK